MTCSNTIARLRLHSLCSLSIQDVTCNPELNGLHGTVTGTGTSAKGTTLFVVSLPASEGVKKKNVKGLKAKNLKLLPPAPLEPGV